MVDDGFYRNLIASAADAWTSYDSRCEEGCLLRIVVHNLKERVIKSV